MYVDGVECLLMCNTTVRSAGICCVVVYFEAVLCGDMWNIVCDGWRSWLADHKREDLNPPTSKG